ncbi:hypothetical protein CCP3SC15_5410001 [Gammaproteobacteria bacterium]
MPFGTGIINNTGIKAIIDWRTGTLKECFHSQSVFTPIDRHPDSGTLIAGRVVPYWREVIELAKRAHHLYSGYPFVGWDIVITATGPLLLEGNPLLFVEFVQNGEDRAFGLGRFAELVEQRIRLLSGSEA